MTDHDFKALARIRGTPIHEVTNHDLKVLARIRGWAEQKGLARDIRYEMKSCLARHEGVLGGIIVRALDRASLDHDIEWQAVAVSGRW